MIHRRLSGAAWSVVLVSLLASAGCNTTYGPRFGPLAYPIPLTPFIQEQMESEAWQQERYDRVPILDPLVPGVPVMALDPPSQDEMERLLERSRPVGGGVPFLYETQRNNVRFVVEQIADSVDPPRVMPLVGPVQLHHARYKCAVYFSETKRVGWPVPYTAVNEDAQEVLYIDHDHLHMVGNVDPANLAAR